MMKPLTQNGSEEGAVVGVVESHSITNEKQSEYNVNDSTNLITASEAGIKFTRYSSKGLLTKKLFLVEDMDKEIDPVVQPWQMGPMRPSKLIKKAAAMMFEGEYETLSVNNLEELDVELNALEFTQATGYGIGPKAKGKICTKKKESANGAISRSKSNFKFSGGPGFMMLDIDPREGNDALSAAAAHAAIVKAMPELNGVRMLCRASASSNIWHTMSKEMLIGPGGWHFYFAVDQADCIPAIGVALGKRLWLDGRGYILISGFGSQLVRSLVDGCVFQGERLDFAAGAWCPENGCIERRPVPSEYFGTEPMLITRDMKGVDDGEDAEYTRLVAAEKEKTRPEAEEQRERWLNARADEALPMDHSAEQRTAYIDNLKATLVDQVLPLDFLVHLEQGKTVTIKEMQADRDKYDGLMICDPFEPEYRYWDRNTKVNLKRDVPELCSWSHGVKNVYTFAAESDDEIYARLAALPAAEYDRIEKDEARAMSVRITTLRAEVKAAQQNLAQNIAAESIVEELEPWDHPVKLEDLLNNARFLLKKHVVLPAGAADAMALWIVASLFMHIWTLFPKLLITSPEMRCGKTTLMEVLEVLAFRAVMVSGATAAAIFRCIELFKPTLFLDEADTFVKTNAEINGVLNAGHKKRAANVLRTVQEGKKFVLKLFSVWCPQIIAGIGGQKPTLHDRSLNFELRRKLDTEKVAKLPKDAYEMGVDFRRQCIRWAADNAGNVSACKVVAPECGNDRAQDNWEPLFVIAELAGKKWKGRVLKAYLRINNAAKNAPRSLGTILLSDIREVFKAKKVDRMFTKDLVDALKAIPDGPWADLGDGKELTQTSLAALLDPYNCKAGSVRIGNDTSKGLYLKKLEDTFKRYL